MSEEKGGAGTSLATKSRYKTPENFFPIVVDDYFNDPEAFVNFGKSLPKEPDQLGRWPGKRSENLWGIDPILTDVLFRKILSCYYDLDYMDISWADSSMMFQEIPRFSENKNDAINKGWIHQDQPSAHQLAGLIYLTPNIDPDSGTSLYTKHINNKLHTQRRLYNDSHFDKKEFTKNYIKHEENFLEKVRFQNIFNRLIAYDTCEFHRANSYYNGDGKDARLTLAFFIGGINIYPLKRVKSNEHESIIKDQIGNYENQ